MSEPFVGEIRMFGLGFAPQGWALRNGQLLPINADMLGDAGGSQPHENIQQYSP